jgi:aldehyde:ferredoxin oxidoreductase
MFGAIPSTLPVVEYLNAATGWGLSPDDYLKTGERILSLRKAFNMREGIRTTDHRLHDRALGKPALTRGPLKGAAVDMGDLRKRFFNTVGWNLETGGPTAEKLMELGIDSFFG